MRVNRSKTYIHFAPSDEQKTCARLLGVMRIKKCKT